VPALGVGKGVARLGVGQAQRADRVARRADQRCPCIEADVWRPRDQRVVGEARVKRGVQHHQHLLLRDRVGAEGHVAAGAAQIQPTSDRENLLVAIHQRDERCGNLEHVARQFEHRRVGIIVEWLERLVLPDGLKPRILVQRYRGKQHANALVLTNPRTLRLNGPCTLASVPAADTSHGHSWFEVHNSARPFSWINIVFQCERRHSASISGCVASRPAFGCTPELSAWWRGWT